MLIRKQTPKNSWTRIDKRVFTLNISDGAKVLYGYMFGLQDSSFYTDKYIIKALRSSQSTITRHKKELKDAGLLEVVQVLPRYYVAYLGNTHYDAQQMAAKWAKEDKVSPADNMRKG